MSEWEAWRWLATAISFFTTTLIVKDFRKAMVFCHTSIPLGLDSVMYVHRNSNVTVFSMSRTLHRQMNEGAAEDDKNLWELSMARVKNKGKGLRERQVIRESGGEYWSPQMWIALLWDRCPSRYISNLTHTHHSLVPIALPQGQACYLQSNNSKI